MEPTKSGQEVDENISLATEVTARNAVGQILSVGDATAVTLLLSDWSNFGLSERVCYHFDLIETLQAASGDHVIKRAVTESPSLSLHIGTKVCGVAALLECIPSLSVNQLTKRQRKTLKNLIKQFNDEALTVQTEKRLACHQPSYLPLPLNPITRLACAYELTKVAFCLDASPTLVSMFGAGNDNDVCCSLDRLPEMVRIFFMSMIEPIVLPYMGGNQTGWTPILAVTVIAVYPRGPDTSNSSLLVRDFRVYDRNSALEISKKIGEWALGEVESQISTRLSSRGAASACDGYDSWTIPKYSTNFRDVLEAGDVALSLLPVEARPCIVVATDARSVACDGILDLFADNRRHDTPLFLLDLSASKSHLRTGILTNEGTCSDSSLLLYDPGGSSAFPLHLSDDSESLYGICKATGGAFFDMELLIEAANNLAGQLPDRSPLAADQYLVNRRRTMKPNALQWYVLFSLSPLSPAPHSSWGKLVPPSYLRRMAMYGREAPSLLEKVENQARERPERLSSADSTLSRRQPSRITFSTYVVSPVRIKVLLLARIKEGYRAKQYGQSTMEKNKVSIQMTLPLELGTVLHYEVQYTSLVGGDPMVGVAHVKLELSGESGYIQLVKTNFLSTATNLPQRWSTIAQGSSARLCKYLRWVRKEDLLQSLLCIISWKNTLSSDDSPFLRRLRALSSLQLGRFFRRNEFDVICKYRVPYTCDDNTKLSELIDLENCERELYNALGEWSNQVVLARSSYVKIISNPGGFSEYAIVHINRSPRVSRLFNVTIDTLSGTDTSDRLILVESLKERLSSLKDIICLDFIIDCFLTGVQQSSTRDSLLADHFSHESWDLAKHPEILPLITKRRNEIAKFWLLHSSDSYARFARLVTAERDVGGILDTYLDEYQIESCEDKVVINMHVERDNGRFFCSNPKGSPEITRAHRLFVSVKRRDQECGIALRSRTKLLGIFQPEKPEMLHPDVQVECLERLLAYAAKQTRKLRFFGQPAITANRILEELTIDLMLSDYFDVNVIKLSISSDAIVAGEKPGAWFLINFDRRTLIIVHITLVEKVEEGPEEMGAKSSYRELTFFTIGISDLYCPRDDVADDESVNGQIIEHLGVEGQIADAIEAAHGRNFAKAAYSALCVDKGNGFSPFLASQDIQYALSFCDFVEVANVFIPISSEETTTNDVVSSSKLGRILGEVLAPLPGNPITQFYFPRTTESLRDHLHSRSFLFHDSDDSYYLISDDSSDDATESGGAVPRLTHDEDINMSEDGSIVLENPEMFIVAPPIFVRFVSDDGHIFSLQELSEVQGISLRILIPMFKNLDPSAVPKVVQTPHDEHPHFKVVNELESILKAYVAEQTLERLRRLGIAIDESGIRSVQRCLRKARNVISDFVDIHFYTSKSDTLITASEAEGNEAALENGFELLYSELSANLAMTLRDASQDTFYVVDTEEASDRRMKYWCFISLKRSFGGCTIEVFHPSGSEKASAVLSAARFVVSQTGKRVNQLLLLKNLHMSRVASSLLISDECADFVSDGSRENDTFGSNSFACPIKFTSTFKLFHRCSATQMILAVEATVLHSFAVSNRRGFFVYKDETGAIFYLNLSPVSSSALNENSIELKVYGVEEPGPSITQQLNEILQKRLLSLSVDTLSSLLTKNPNFNWKKEDLQLIRSFRRSFSVLGEGDEVQINSEDSIYEFPEQVFDPLAVLLYFKQNLCGSTFFHRLQDQNSEQAEIDAMLTIQGEGCCSGFGLEVKFDPSEFRFFYNNAPSPLDPGYEHLSTLTLKGSEYARMAGNGIALIELTLVDKQGYDISNINVGLNIDKMRSSLDSSLISLRMRKLAHDGSIVLQSSYGVRVRIVDTAMNRIALHRWIQLTLDQVLVSWSMERHIERVSKKLLTTDTVLKNRQENQSSYTIRERQAILDQLCPGLQTFLFLCQSSYNLPHPAIDQVEHHGVIKASSVATLALSMLDRNVMGALVKSGTPWTNRNVIIVRMSREQRPKLVSLNWDASHQVARVHELGLDNPPEFKDFPIDCPEYICFYCHQRYSADEGNANSVLSLLLKEVMVDTKLSESKSRPFTSAMQFLKENNPSVFMRSLAFVLIVKRNRRLLLTYNWDPRILVDVKARIKEVETSATSSFGLSLHTQQRKCLGALSPPVATGRFLKKTVNVAKSDKGKDSADRMPEKGLDVNNSIAKPALHSAGTMKTHVRRIQRPTMIRRPTLVGKSVEGAAVQAVAASRARASSNRFSHPTLANKSVLKDGTSTRRQSNVSDDSIRKAKIRDGEDQSTFGQKKERVATEAEVVGLFGAYDNTNSLARIPRPTNTLLQKIWIDPSIQALSFAMRNFILMQSTKLCIDTVELLLALPRFDNHDVLSSFTDFLQMQFPGLRSLPTKDGSSQCETLTSVFLLIQLKLAKCVVFRLQLSKEKPGKRIVRLDTWLLQLPPSKTKKIRKRNLPMAETICAAADNQLAACQNAFNLDVQFFNFSGHLIEKLVESENSESRWHNALILLQQLVEHHSYEKQHYLWGLCYNVFEATIVLASYKSNIIDMYDAQQLYDSLNSGPDMVNMMRCGPDAMCFLPRILANGTISFCFLLREPRVTKKLKLLILCRNEGRNIEHYMFPDGSNVAAKIVNVIIVQAARLTYDALELAGNRVRRMALWESFTVKRRGHSPTVTDFEDFLDTAFSRSLLQIDEVLKSFSVADNEMSTNWSLLVTCMKKDNVFLPFWSFLVKGSTKLIFYIGSLDCFLMFDTLERTETEIVDMKILIQEAALESQQAKAFQLAQIITNYILYFTWQTT